MRQSFQPKESALNSIALLGIARYVNFLEGVMSFGIH